LFKGQNQQDIKEQNRALVLKLICTEQCLSRIEISRLTGLTKMTVTNITVQLIRDGFIKEGFPFENQGTTGRKPITLLPCNDSVYAIGVYISRDFIKVSLLSISAEIIQTCTQVLSEGENSKSLIQKTLKGIKRIIGSIPKSKILGIGIASIGPLDTKSGVILSPPDFYNIKNVEIKKNIEENTGLKVILNNDMKASSLAEKLFGKGENLQNFIYLGITHGIGSGIVMDGKLFSGEMGYAGEVGHTTIDFNGPICSCGNRGCLEAYASIPNILKVAKERIEGNTCTILSSMNEFTFQDIAQHAQSDPLCCSLINDMALHIGIALVNTINTLDLSTVIIGHEGAYGGTYLAGLIEKYINEKMLFRSSKHVSVIISNFCEESPLIGSGTLVLDEFFTSGVFVK